MNKAAEGVLIAQGKKATDTTVIKLFKEENEDGDEVFYLERELTVRDLASMMAGIHCRIPDTVLQGLTGRARMWLDKPSWALEYVEDPDEEPVYFSL